MGLKSIVFGNSLIKIGENAFAGCTGLTSVVIGNAVRQIGNSAFRGCKSLKNLLLGNSVKKIGERAFWGCKRLKSVNIPASVTEFGKEAFLSATNIHFSFADEIRKTLKDSFMRSSQKVLTAIVAVCRKMFFNMFSVVIADKIKMDELREKCNDLPELFTFITEFALVVLSDEIVKGDIEKPTDVNGLADLITERLDVVITGFVTSEFFRIVVQRQMYSRIQMLPTTGWFGLDGCQPVLALIESTSLRLE